MNCSDCKNYKACPMLIFPLEIRHLCPDWKNLHPVTSLKLHLDRFPFHPFANELPKKRLLDFQLTHLN